LQLPERASPASLYPVSKSFSPSAPAMNSRNASLSRRQLLFELIDVFDIPSDEQSGSVGQKRVQNQSFVVLFLVVLA
jgi:hypothetical protein